MIEGKASCPDCTSFPCTDIRHQCYIVPRVELNPQNISMIVISEAAPADPADYYYAEGDPLFQCTTVQAFNDAGAKVASIQDTMSI